MGQCAGKRGRWPIGLRGVVAREFVGHWSGRIAPGHESEHKALLDFLRSPAGHTLLQKYGLLAYALHAQGDELQIRFTADKPTTLPGVLKNKVLWPAFWTFESSAPFELPAGATFRWARE